MKLISDANVVIDAHTYRVWPQLIGKYQLLMTPSVIRESQFYRIRGHKYSIDLQHYIDKGLISVVSASLHTATQIIRKVAQTGHEIQIGEAESIAVLLELGHTEVQFCTADHAAVYATYLYGVADRLISLERCIRVKKTMKLPIRCTEQALNHWKAQAIQQFGVDI